MSPEPPSRYPSQFRLFQVSSNIPFNAQPLAKAYYRETHARRQGLLGNISGPFHCRLPRTIHSRERGKERGVLRVFRVESEPSDWRMKRPWERICVVELVVGGTRCLLEFRATKRGRHIQCLPLCFRLRGTTGHLWGISVAPPVFRHEPTIP